MGLLGSTSDNCVRSKKFDCRVQGERPPLEVWLLIDRSEDGLIDLRNIVSLPTTQKFISMEMLPHCHLAQPFSQPLLSPSVRYGTKMSEMA